MLGVLSGTVTIETGELYEIQEWARFGCPGGELALLGIGEVEGEEEEEETLAWANSLPAQRISMYSLLLSV